MSKFNIHIDVVLDCDDEILGSFLEKENLTIVYLQKLWGESFFAMIDDELKGDSGFTSYDITVSVESEDE